MAKIRALENSFTQERGMNDLTGIGVAKISSKEGVAKGGEAVEEIMTDVEEDEEGEDECEWTTVDTPGGICKEDEEGAVAEEDKDEGTGLHFL